MSTRRFRSHRSGAPRDFQPTQTLVSRLWARAHLTTGGLARGAAVSKRGVRVAAGGPLKVLNHCEVALIRDGLALVPRGVAAS
eukprot:8302420-Pyramimonas_sp.AAC.1